MKKLMIPAAVAAVAALASACSKENNTPAVTGDAIEFRALIDKNVNSRASLVDRLDQMSSFFVVAGRKEPGNYALDFMQSAVWRTGSSGGYIWNYSPNKYYPADGTPLNFYAYAPIKDVNMLNEAELTIDSGSGKVQFEYAVPFDQSVSNTAVDLLVASVLNKSDDGTAVAFEFDHALSGVTFSAGNENPAESELVYVISNIEISALCNEGVFEYPYTWETTGSQDFFKAGVPESGVSLMPAAGTVKLLSANDIMMVLPQETNATGVINSPDSNGVPGDLGTTPYVKVVFSVKDGSGAFIYKNRARYLPLPLDFSFDAGTLYNFQFKFEQLDAITFEVTELNGWANDDLP